MAEEPRLSLDEFKRWMKEHDDRSFTMEKKQPENEVGRRVIPCVGAKRLLTKIAVETHNPEEVAADFFKSGGKIVAVDGKHVVIEVDSGTFSIKRCYVRED